MKTEKIYQLSERDYDIISQAVRFNPDACRALKRAVVIKNNKQPSHVEKESLTEDKMKSLFGESYKHILYYNFDEKKWNTEKYFNGIFEWKDVTDVSKKFKSALERNKCFQGLELVASVVMGIRSEVYPGWGEVIKKPSPVIKKPGAIVGTIVCRDKMSGKIVYLPNAWLGVQNWGQEKNNDVMSTGAYLMALFGGKNVEFRSTLMKIHNKQK